jgi:hypothetical protein
MYRKAARVPYVHPDIDRSEIRLHSSSGIIDLMMICNINSQSQSFAAESLYLFASCFQPCRAPR